MHTNVSDNLRYPATVEYCLHYKYWQKKHETKINLWIGITV